eukprot:CAMPEP_0202442564 /NCGR_PEP_ID=MMETSP1360-20130828/1982_1 /ASSEMBLY_ACC=CAM_ASM_000848 /TAXON_ID=515479 /ORGANISM="Licmophora paradoxa, Strain CCMP2313" /LENGTH=78 /DNA_ID=CAMNT_0049057963 /DNA_START=1 /DNA_END=237 /DNA_ORIENTATION=+
MTSTTKTPTMADELNPNSDKEAIYHRVLYLSNGGSSLKEACMIVEKETGQSWGTTKNNISAAVDQLVAHNRRNMAIEN